MYICGGNALPLEFASLKKKYSISSKKNIKHGLIFKIIHFLVFSLEPEFYPGDYRLVMGWGGRVRDSGAEQVMLTPFYG